MATTPTARLASKDFAPAPLPVNYTPTRWIGGQIVSWLAFFGFLLGFSAVLLGVVRLCASFDENKLKAGGLGESIGNILLLVLVFVMITATLLTMADRKWSALMQDRVGPNRARLPIPGLSNSPLAGLPHIVADVLKMLFKEDFISEGAAKEKLLFNLGPLLSFGPAFMLFAIVPVGPEVTILGKRIALQVAHLDWGILYVFGLASIGVFGTALAGWASDNKFALLGGLRASAQLVSYEVTLGLTLVGTFIAYGTLRLDEMTALQGAAEAAWRSGGSDPTLLFGWLPAWGIFLQPLGCVLFVVAAMAEIKRPPFDTPEGESEIIGYFVEYSGLKSGLFLIAEYVETVVVCGIIVAMFFGGWHIPWVEPALGRFFIDNVSKEHGLALLAVLQVFAFVVKTLAAIWVFFIIRWAFPRFRYDQVMRLGWKMMLPVSLANVVVSAGVFLWGGRPAMAMLGLVELLALGFFIAFSDHSPVAHAADHGHGGHGHDDGHGQAAPAASH
jgi:NADH-quinone oxidoreductase subunit H